VLHQGRVLYDGSPDDFLEAEHQSSIESAYLSLINRTNADQDLKPGSPYPH
jgi:hypothetical protein